jgi:hypothetical protein
MMERMTNFETYYSTEQLFWREYGADERRFEALYSHALFLRWTFIPLGAIGSVCAYKRARRSYGRVVSGLIAGAVLSLIVSIYEMIPLVGEYRALLDILSEKYRPMFIEA